jgi:hypothetical protein
LPIFQDQTLSGAFAVDGIMVGGAVAQVAAPPASMRGYVDQVGPIAALLIDTLIDVSSCHNPKCSCLTGENRSLVLAAGYEGLAALSGQILAFLDQMDPLQREDAFRVHAEVREASAAVYADNNGK